MHTKIRKLPALAGIAGLAALTLVAILVVIPLVARVSTAAAVIIGAYAGPTMSDWLSESSRIGPFRSDRIFYRNNLPPSYRDPNSAGASCYLVWRAKPNATCVVSYKTLNTNVASYVASVPRQDQMIITWHHEPENETFSGSCGSSEANFVCGFETQSRRIRQAARCTDCHVRVAMIAGAYQYDAGTSHDAGADCSFIPPSPSVDMYLVDIYQNAPNGNSLGTAADGVGTEWNTWLECAQPAGSTHKPIGIAEYGLNTATPDAVRAQTLRADDAYFRGNFPDLQLWEAWDIGRHEITGTQSVKEWKAIEAGH